MKKKNILIVLTIILLILIDQISKILIFNYIIENRDMVIIPGFLNFTHVKNTGAAFGILEGKRVFFIILTVLALLYLSYELYKSKKKKYCIFLVLIISGIIGNFIDRLFLGYVRDFISFKIFEPVFNIADCFIVIGVILFVIFSIVGEKNESKTKLDK